MGDVLTADFSSTRNRDAAIVFAMHLANLIQNYDGVKSGDNALKAGVLHAVTQFAKNVGEDTIYKPFSGSPKIYSPEDIADAICDYLDTEDARKGVLKSASVLRANAPNDYCGFIRDALIYKNSNQGGANGTPELYIVNS